MHVICCPRVLPGQYCLVDNHRNCTPIAMSLQMVVIHSPSGHLRREHLDHEFYESKCTKYSHHPNTCPHQVPQDEDVLVQVSLVTCNQSGRTQALNASKIARVAQLWGGYLWDLRGAPEKGVALGPIFSTLGLPDDQVTPFGIC